MNNETFNPSAKESAMFQRLHHLGLAVRDIDEAVALYAQAFGVGEWERIALPERHMAVAVARVGETLIELIAPTSEEAAFAKFLRERGPGMHHVAYQVDDIAAALQALQAQGVQLIDAAPRPGIHNTLVAFVHPKATLGTLIELVQEQTHA
jgi:methylmalonyl-CoA/ethylmalonyl-CoA epimerase